MDQIPENEKLDVSLGDADTLGSWRTHLAAFDERIWPMFQSYGYSKDTALMVWFLNDLKNTLDGDLEQLLETLDDRA